MNNALFVQDYKGTKAVGTKYREVENMMDLVGSIDHLSSWRDANATLVLLKVSKALYTTRVNERCRRQVMAQHDLLEYHSTVSVALNKGKGYGRDCSRRENMLILMVL